MVSHVAEPLLLRTSLVSPVRLMVTSEASAGISHVIVRYLPAGGSGSGVGVGVGVGVGGVGEGFVSSDLLQAVKASAAANTMERKRDVLIGS